MTFSATSNHMMFLTSAIRGLDYHTIEAAKNMGASQSTILFKVVLPTMKPTIFAITVLTFIAALSTMSGPLIVGGPDFQTINPMIKTFANMTGSRDIAALLAIILGLATTVLLAIMQHIEKKGNFISVSKTKARMEKQKIENPVLNVLAHIAAYVMLVIYMLPILNVLVFSFTDGLTIKTGQIRKDSFTLESREGVFTAPIGFDCWAEGETSVKTKDTDTDISILFEKVAASGAWKEDGSYCLKLCFEETSYINTLRIRFVGNGIFVEHTRNCSFMESTDAFLTGVVED